MREYYYGALDNAKKSSTSGIRTKYKKQKINVKPIFVALTIAGIVSTGIFMNKVNAESVLFDNYTNEYVTMFNNEVKRTNDNQHYYYEYNDLAHSALKAEDPDAFLYIAYQHMSNGSYLDELIKSLKRINPDITYDDWDGYLESLGYDETNKKAYSFDMRKEIIENAKEKANSSSNVVKQ